MPEIRSRLAVPNEPAYLLLVQDFLARASDMAALQPGDAQRLALAVDEAFSNVLRYGFEPGAREDVEVRFEASAGLVHVTLAYTGLPFDPAQIPAQRPGLKQYPGDKGLGTAIMRAMCDSVEMRNLGRGRVEIVLTKRAGEPGPEQEVAAPDEPAPGLPQEAFTIRPMRPAEAVQISRLVYNAYGESYAHDDFYFPERVRAMNAEGRMCSHVAVTGSGEVVAHGALLRETPVAQVAEMGAAFTQPGHRGQGCNDGLARDLLRTAQEKGVGAVFVTAVTSHSYSQKSARRHGLTESALLVAEVPPLRFRSIAEASEARETFLLMFREIGPSRPTVIHPPAAHAPMLERIRRAQGCAAVCGLQGQEPPDGPRTILSAEVNHAYNVAALTVQEYGRDFSEALRTQLRGLLARGCGPVRLSLPLDHPATAVMTPRAEEMGFFFSGLAPAASGGLNLMLQHLGGLFYDYSRITVSSDLGQELLDYVRAADPAQ